MILILIANLTKTIEKNFIIRFAKIKRSRIFAPSFQKKIIHLKK
ncbi:hypothetical protein P700755_003892 [Psychroflexus torquis ATCC 700755]|uniref:Uncharacterized protein n=1 Tax=Psychroflexus torquis (strain ATCC 700755 / CIP 106069 / ACAM 623) TaxID=313595 RepID=K4IYB2_PSYTT|nr:hypothetical protein P700755_003892 [Psychroflexus torquis ATCC 700755]